MFNLFFCVDFIFFWAAFSNDKYYRSGMALGMANLVMYLLFMESA